MPDKTEIFSAEDLVQVFGDQAYHKGVRMAIEALRSGDMESSRKLAAANLELMRRGYHKHPERDAG
jgi:hypothetical protein